MIMAANRFGQRNMIDVDFSAFDSEVIELIDALGLIPIGSPDFRYHLACIIVSDSFGRYPLCERYKQHQLMKRLDSERLCRRLYKRNSPRFREVLSDGYFSEELDF